MARRRLSCDSELIELLEFTDAEPPTVPLPTKSSREPRGALPALGEWQRHHDSILAAAARPIAVSATGLAAEQFTEEGDPGEIEPLPRGRTTGDGAAIGRAVHAVLQSIALASGVGLSEACVALAAAEGVSGRAELIEALCRSALESDVVQRAAQHRHFREVYVGVPEGGRVLEGFIDLLYEEDDGVAIVDYKTDSWKNISDLDAKVEQYRGQMMAYARAVREAIRREITSVTLLFLSRNGAVSRQMDV